MNKQQQDENFERCEKSFVSYTWFVGLVIVLAGACIVIGMSYAKEQSLQDAAITAVGFKTETIYADIKIIKENNDKLDTLLAIVRRK